MSSQLSQALSATRDLEVALILVDDDGPEGGYVVRAPSANDLVAATVQQLSGTAPAGGAPLAETLVETASWLQGGPKDSESINALIPRQPVRLHLASTFPRSLTRAGPSR